ncbi:hypothetical protein [Oceanivirga salmonicida]|uniref:hypothetical protein n=1 Tax=Oceanivirga salmonicida TaxID=1769291 RepID=UPI00082F9D3C|nr:hypothetical protein [Oceanivirga salmonicida]
MTNKYIIGLCLILSILISGIFYKSNYDKYLKLFLEEENNNIRLTNLQKEIAELEAQIQAKSTLKVDNVDKDKFDAISISKNELKRFLYETALKTNIEIINISSEVIYKKYDRYYLKYISLELNSNLEDLFYFLYKLNNSDIYIDFKNFSMVLKYGQFIISLGYVEKGEIN